MEDSFSGSTRQTEIQTRLDAYRVAREIVASLYAVKNDRGYPKFVGNANDVLTQEIRVATFLLNE